MADKKMRKFQIKMRSGGCLTIDAAYWMCGGSSTVSGAAEAEGFVVFKALDHHIVLGVARDEVLTIHEISVAED